MGKILKASKKKGNTKKQKWTNWVTEKQNTKSWIQVPKDSIYSFKGCF